MSNHAIWWDAPNLPVDGCRIRYAVNNDTWKPACDGDSLDRACRIPSFNYNKNYQVEVGTVANGELDNESWALDSWSLPTFKQFKM